MKIWHCWIYSKRRGNITKVPVAASGEETGPDEAHRNTWVTFDEAKTATAEKHFDGIGFVIPKGYFFLDIDHRPVDDPFVVKMLERFSSYTEYSVSGGGIHIYGRCDFSKIPSEMKDNKLTLNRKYYIKNPTNDTELYIGGLTNRFAVFTENMILNEPLRECTDAIFVTLEEDMLRRSQYNDVNKDNKDSVDIELNAEIVVAHIGNDLFHRGVRLTKADVIGDCIVEEINVLKNKAVVFHEVVHAVVADIFSIEGDCTLVHIPEAGKKMTEGCLTAATWTNDCGCAVFRN